MPNLIGMSNGTIFSDIADNYDRINWILSLGQDQNWRRTVVSRLPEGRLLDLGSGTGAANTIFGDRTVVAIDPAPEMLALNSATRRAVSVGEKLPFADGTFDAVFSAYVFRNLDSVDATLAEIARVLRPGGRAGIVDLGRPTVPWKAKLHRAASGPLLRLVDVYAGAGGEYRYLNASMDKLPQPEVMFAVDGPLTLEHSWRMGPLGFVYGAILDKPAI